MFVLTCLPCQRVHLSFGLPTSLFAYTSITHSVSLSLNIITTAKHSPQVTILTQLFSLVWGLSFHLLTLTFLSCKAISSRLLIQMARFELHQSDTSPLWHHLFPSKSHWLRWENSLESFFFYDLQWKTNFVWANACVQLLLYVLRCMWCPRFSLSLSLTCYAWISMRHLRENREYCEKSLN